MPNTDTLAAKLRQNNGGTGMVNTVFEERMLTTAEVSKWLGIAQRTVCTWAECGELPGIKIGRQWRFRHRELMTWLDNSKTGQNGTEGLRTLRI